MPSELMTTIKVPKSLRERLARNAAREGQTAAALIAALLDEQDRRERFAAVREAYAGTDASYLQETKEWEALTDDGLIP